MSADPERNEVILERLRMLRDEPQVTPACIACRGLGHVGGVECGACQGSGRPPQDDEVS